MTYTVKQLAEISGVSVRTLHFYDEIHLLKPQHRNSHGYRFYQREQLLVLQQILFFKELGFDLKNIKSILKKNSFDQINALKEHKRFLQSKKARLTKLLKTVDVTIKQLKGEAKMNDKQLYYGFAPEKQKEYEQYLVDSGKISSKQLKEFQRVFSKKDFDDLKGAKQKAEQINAKLVEAIKNGCAIKDPSVQKLIHEHYFWIKKMWEPTLEANKERYIELGNFYVEHEDFKKYFDESHKNLATFLREAMTFYANKNL